MQYGGLRPNVKQLGQHPKSEAMFLDLRKVVSPRWGGGVLLPWEGHRIIFTVQSKLKKAAANGAAFWCLV